MSERRRQKSWAGCGKSSLLEVLVPRSGVCTGAYHVELFSFLKTPRLFFSFVYVISDVLVIRRRLPMACLKSVELESCCYC